ncbi:polysaccharide deacetylase family protein, partial [Candidatus Dojkabacteria bacterium]|nr:polysaccharide deacetylase family protein [Candidatus Dojkabacteria bacterium]
VVNKYFQVLDLSVFTSSFETKLEMEVRRRAYAREFESRYDPSNNQFNVEEKAFSVPILNYHGISDSPYKGDILTETFKEHIYSLKNAGYETVSLEDFILFIKGEKDLPENSIVITFDDGIRSSYIKATPILESVDFNAVMFVITKFSMHEGTHYYLSLEEVKDMESTPTWEIQPHAYDSHQRTLVGPDEYGTYLGNKRYIAGENRLETTEEYRVRISTEFKNTYEEFSKYMGYTPISFAYPFGDYGHTSKNFPGARQVLAEEIVPYFNTANFFQTWPSQGPSRNYSGEAADNLYRRISVHPDWSGEELLSVLDRGSPKVLDYADDHSTNKGWKSLWGNVLLEGGQLNISPEASFSAAAFLDGTISWSDYDLNAKISSFEGDSFSVAFNFIDKQNFDSCEFTKNNLKIETRRDGVTTIVASKELLQTMPEDANINVGLLSTSDVIECYLASGESLRWDNIEDTTHRSRGGIGFI